MKYTEWEILILLNSITVCPSKIFFRVEVFLIRTGNQLLSAIQITIN